MPYPSSPRSICSPRVKTFLLLSYFSGSSRFSLSSSAAYSARSFFLPAVSPCVALSFWSSCRSLTGEGFVAGLQTGWQDATRATPCSTQVAFLTMILSAEPSQLRYCCMFSLLPFMFDAHLTLMRSAAQHRVTRRLRQQDLS